MIIWMEISFIQQHPTMKSKIDKDIRFSAATKDHTIDNPNNMIYASNRNLNDPDHVMVTILDNGNYSSIVLNYRDINYLSQLFNKRKNESSTSTD